MARTHSGVRQRKWWGSLADATAAFSGGTLQALMVNNNFGKDPVTVLRILGELLVTFPNQTLVANDAAAITVVIGVVSADAAAVGITAMPDPASDPDYPWLWWYSTVLRNFNITTETKGMGEMGSSRIRVESQAMRKIAPAENLVVIAEWQDITGVPSVTVDWAGARVLLGE